MKVNKTKTLQEASSARGWNEAVRLTGIYLERPGRADELLGTARRGMDDRDFARCQNLFYAVVRNLSLLRSAMDSLCPRSPTQSAIALLYVSAAELLEAGTDTGAKALVTHHAVTRASELLPARMKGFVNAVMRRLPEALENEPEKISDPLEKLALKHSHPLWLAKRWERDFGIENTKFLLEWDQTPAEAYIRLEEGVAAPACLKASRWTGYYTYQGGGGWGEIADLLSARRAYAQDPSTRLCVDTLAPQAGMRILDLCAAPGGKARQLLSRMGEGQLVCVDLPGARCKRLRENLAGLDNERMKVSIVESDVFELSAEKFRSLNLPESYDAVLLDAPCSNTGVLRRRPDARWRLKETDISSCAALQAKLLTKAATFVKEGGRIVYSTCSIDPEENALRVDAFLKTNADFSEYARVQALPWKDEHDGAGVSGLKRN